MTGPLGILLGDDGLRTRREEGSILRLCFVESAKNVYVDIKVPKKLPTASDIMAVDDVAYDVRRMRCPGVGNRESNNLSILTKVWQQTSPLLDLVREAKRR